MINILDDFVQKPDDLLIPEFGDNPILQIIIYIVFCFVVFGVIYLTVIRPRRNKRNSKIKDEK